MSMVASFSIIGRRGVNAKRPTPMATASDTAPASATTVTLGPEGCRSTVAVGESTEAVICLDYRYLSVSDGRLEPAGEDARFKPLPPTGPCGIKRQITRAVKERSDPAVTWPLCALRI